MWRHYNGNGVFWQAVKRLADSFRHDFGYIPYPDNISRTQVLESILHHGHAVWTTDTKRIRQFAVHGLLDPFQVYAGAAMFLHPHPAPARAAAEAVLAVAAELARSLAQYRLQH